MLTMYERCPTGGVGRVGVVAFILFRWRDMATATADERGYDGDGDLK